MLKDENQINERIPFKSERTPLIHDMPTRVGVMCTHSKVLLKGALVVSAGSANGTSIGENPGGLLQSIKVQATTIAAGYPTGTLKNLTARSILRRRIFDRMRFVPDVSLGINGFNGAAATYVLNMPFELNYSIPWLRRPFDTALDTGKYGSLQLTILNGARDIQFSGNDRTFDYSGVAWDIYHYFERYDGVGAGPVAVLYDDDLKRNISGANTRLQLNKELPNDGAYTDILWMSETTNSALSDAIINKITLQSGVEQWYEKYSDAIKDEMQDWVVDTSANTVLTGLYWSPVIQDGLLTGAKPNVQAIIDQLNPGTDDLLMARRRIQMVPDQYLNKGQKAA
jgi:hypothetical protein